MVEFYNWKEIFTDGSVSNDGKASIGIFSEWNGSSVGIRVSDGISIFHAECLALQKALDTVLGVGSGLTLSMISTLEYILDPSKLSCDLVYISPEDACEVMLLFLQSAQTYRDMNDPMSLITIRDGLLPKKSVSLRLLALKVAAFFKWNILSENFRERIPNYLQRILVLDLLELVRGEVSNPNEHVSIPLETLPPETVLAVSLYHRWILNNTTQQDVIPKPRNTALITGPATGSSVVNLGAFTQMMDLTQKQLAQKVDESFTVLEKLLKCQTASMPSVDAFVPPDPSGRDFIFYFDKSEMIHLAEYRIQLYYDLGSYCIFKKKQQEAAGYFRSAANIYSQVDSSTFTFCKVQQMKLEGYLAACEVVTESSRRRNVSLAERLHESIKNNFEDTLEILREDNKVRQIPIFMRDLLEYDMVGAASNGTLFDAGALIANVRLLNVVRRVIDGMPMLENLKSLVIDGISDGARVLLKHFEDASVTFQQPEKLRVRSFLHRICSGSGVTSKALQRALMDSKLNIMYTSEEITEITGGRFSPSDPPVQAEYLDVATEPGKAEALQRLISSYDLLVIRELISTIGRLGQGKQVWAFSMRWEIPIPFQSTIMGLPKGFLQDFAYICLAKSRELTNQEEYIQAQSFISAIDEEVRQLLVQQNLSAPSTGFPTASKLLLMLQWESYLIDCIRALKEWPRRKVSAAFAKAPLLSGQKRNNTGAVATDSASFKMNHLSNFCLHLCEPVTLSVMISCLCQLYNIVRDEVGNEILVEYPGFWPPNVPNPFGYYSIAVFELLYSLVDRALKLHPRNHTWLKIMGDLDFTQDRYNMAMRWYIEACISSSDCFSVPVPKTVMDEALLRRMIKACQKMQKSTEAAILCQFLEPPDYAVAFKCLQEKTSCDGMDSLYPCIWDMAILEFLTAQHTRRGEPKKEDTVAQAGLLELNSNNNEEIQKEAICQRKSRFLRALAREYIVL
ncbi:integrator complex subunit 8-like isoform X4 [Artemia franciscana]|uniref:integrator complex subunit 8-like isoform X4 n=1 Tax=Artemia franciscana TaxID=6661 RepID=UPI0032DA1C08